MSLPVFVHPALAGLVAGAGVELAGDEARHAVVVKRVRVGERVALTDGAGTTATCTVTATSKSSLAATVDTVATTEPELPRVVVVQAIPKGDRGELAVEMLTEVGVDVIVPWAAARSVSVWRGDSGDKSLASWRSSVAGGRQAGPPVVVPVGGRGGRPPSEVVDLLRDASVPVVLHEAASGPLADLPVPGRGEIVIVVGPEGGISDEELAAFAAVGAEPVRMGTSVLRTSTAGVAATAALLARTRWR